MPVVGVPVVAEVIGCAVVVGTPLLLLLLVVVSVVIGLAEVAVVVSDVIATTGLLGVTKRRVPSCTRESKHKTRQQFVRGSGERRRGRERG